MLLSGSRALRTRTTCSLIRNSGSSTISVAQTRSAVGQVPVALVGLAISSRVSSVVAQVVVRGHGGERGRTRPFRSGLVSAGARFGPTPALWFDPRGGGGGGEGGGIGVEIDLDEVIFGTHRDIDVDTAVRCEVGEGSCCQKGTQPEKCDICAGSGSINRAVRSLLGNVMTQSPCGSCRGYGTTIPHPCPTCAGQGRVRGRRTVSVDIPAGVSTGVRLQMPGSGEAGPAGGPHGDLYLEMKVRDHDLFSRNGDDLLCQVDVSVTDAILGTTCTVAALDGDVTLEIRPGVQAGDVLTIAGRGITRLRGSGRGDLKVGVHVVTPTKLSTKERQLVEQLAALRKAAAPSISGHGQGLFARIRDRVFG